jgi:hypothetical protein
MIKDNTIKTSLTALMRNALSDGINFLKAHIAQQKDQNWPWLTDYHSDFPSMNWSDSVFPSFHISSYGKIDYHKVFAKDGRDRNTKSWQTYHDFVVNNEELCAHLLIGKHARVLFNTATDEFIDMWNTVHTYYFIGHFLDCYVHKFGLEFNMEKYESLFLPFYNSLVLEELPITIYVPIIFCTSAIDNFEINDRISFERLTDEIQLSRNIKHSFNSSGHPIVMASATHAFVIRGSTVPNPNIDTRHKTLSNITAYSQIMDTVNMLFGSLRVAHPGIETGYFQIIAKPENWTTFSTADLIDLSVVSDRHYPNHFEDYGWLNDPSNLNLNALDKIKNVFRKVSTSEYFTLALNRLNKACLNSRHDDAIIDVSIALESLLTSDTRSEITYRLATRAVLLNKRKQFKTYDSESIFLLCKKLYDFRSAVVHGDAKQHKKTRTLTISSQEEIEAVSLGIQYLEHVLLTIIDIPEIKNPKDIDRLLFIQ